MTPPRDRAELVALMARAIYETHYGQPPDVDDEGMSHDEARSALAALEASGVALVPVVATPTMLNEGGAGIYLAKPGEPCSATAREAFKIMLAAGPYAPEARSDGE